MDRRIEVKINGSYVTKDCRNAGVQHEGNVTYLRLEFDPGWDGYAKKITWWNAKGENPVALTLGADRLENLTESTRIYLCPIPAEALGECGECTFVVDGYADGKRQRSAADRLTVKEAPCEENPGESVSPTPSQAEQLQREIDKLLPTLQADKRAAQEAGAAAELARDQARESAASAQEQAAAAKNQADRAQDQADRAQGQADRAAAALEGLRNTQVSAVTVPETSQAAANNTQVGNYCQIRFEIPRGRQGATGPAGPQGVQGPRGEDGPQGPTGPRGETGATGDTGPAGPQGVAGKQGLTGPAGPTGPEGKRGPQGPQGVQGPEGKQGPVGPQGPQGERGPQGEKGVAAVVPTAGSYAFHVDGEGHLILSYTGDSAPDFAVAENGHLILTL